MSSFGQHFDIISSRMLTIENMWRSAKFSPNKAQREAILHVDGPLYLTAGPGSGKTRVLLWRTLNLMVFHGVEPEEIFLSTFTEKAALQLKEGLRSLLGLATNLNGKPYDLSAMYIGTVHSLCQRMLSDRRKFAIDIHDQRPPTLMDALGQYFHLSRNRTWDALTQQVGLGEDTNAAVNQLFGITSQSKHVAVVQCLSLFNRFSEEMIAPDRALARLREPGTELQTYLAAQPFTADSLCLLLRLYDTYRQSLVDENGARQTDFSLLQQEAYELIRGAEGTSRAFKYVIVDEYQDTNTIQERIFFELAKATGNICIVGDDDQALYRFRGATVENFVDFPARCRSYLGQAPHRISLSINYRSRPSIVDFYTRFMQHTNWARGDGQSGHYRVIDKDIRAHRPSTGPAVVASAPGKPVAVCEEVADLVRRLLDEGKVEDPNQIAFLFPSLKYRGAMVRAVERMKTALEAVGLQVYAPRAGRFLEVDEAYDVFGLFLQIFGKPKHQFVRGHDMQEFAEWLRQADTQGKALLSRDPLLKQFVQDRQAELERIRTDRAALMSTIHRKRWDLHAPYDLRQMKRALIQASGFSGEGQRLLGSRYLDRMVEDRARKGQPMSLLYILRRVTSVDWNVLDLFYRFCGFAHFKAMFDAAETGHDEGPVSNLGLITQYLARFMEGRVSMITADVLEDQVFQRVFFSSYLFALYRLGETEFEDAEDPFPKGRIPFLTIHQAKGLEFPVVVLGNLRKDNRGPGNVETMTRALLEREPGEPLARMSEFDIMRMFYVALSRAKNLLVLAHYKGRGQRINPPFKALLDDDFTRIPDFDIDALPVTRERDDALPKTYSFTADYLMYKKCPRQYMIFRKYGFVPSRTETMFFGSLVHRTLDDLHHELIKRRQADA